MIKLGDRITVKPATFDVPGKDGKPKGVPGTVVYPSCRAILCSRVRGRQTGADDHPRELSAYRREGSRMKHEQSAPAGYRPRFAGTMKLYLVRHKEYGELTVNGVNKYEAVHAAARAWGVRWTAIARECEYIVLAEDTPEDGRP